MSLFFKICIALSVGLLLGVLGGAVKATCFRKPYSRRQVEQTRRLLARAAAVLKYLVILLLALSFIWCVYFLVLAIAVPEQAEYANNMAELVIAVLTVPSILFAFVEFIRHKEGDHGKDAGTGEK